MKQSTIVPVDQASETYKQANLYQTPVFRSTPSGLIASIQRKTTSAIQVLIIDRLVSDPASLASIHFYTGKAKAELIAAPADIIFNGERNGATGEVNFGVNQVSPSVVRNAMIAATNALDFPNVELGDFANVSGMVDKIKALVVPTFAETTLKAVLDSLMDEVPSMRAQIPSGQKIALVYTQDQNNGLIHLQTVASGFVVPEVGRIAGFEFTAPELPSQTVSGGRLFGE